MGNKNKTNYILKMGTHMLGTWIKSITGHNTSNLNSTPKLILPVGCLKANETLHHLMTDCETTALLQMDIMKNQFPITDMTWSVKGINKFIQHPLIHSFMTYETQYNNREM